MDYSDFSSLDFVMDDYFKLWVLYPDSNHDHFWENWLKEHPEKVSTVNEARKILGLINFDVYKPSDDYFSMDWEKLQLALNNNDASSLNNLSNSESIKTHRKLNLGSLYRLAAAAAMLILFSGLIYFISPSFMSSVYKTGYGETNTITLPDNSVVILNANSKIRLSNHWETDEHREVWLEGEGFFSVTHKKNNQRFIVHTKNLTIEVLGTEFNVNNRRGTTNVVLNKGKVKVNTTGSDELFMKPGELVSFSESEKKLKKIAVDPTIYTIWKNDLLVFSNTPLSEIAQMLEDNYGLEIIFEDKELKNKRFTGSISSKNIDVLITSIAESFHLRIIRNNNIVKFKIKSS